MISEFTGRKKEQEVLHKALYSKEAEMVSVIGRRRIGKTFLIKTVYQGHIAFELTGTKGDATNCAGYLRLCGFLDDSKSSE